jgi:hypothetical protein
MIYIKAKAVSLTTRTRFRSIYVSCYECTCSFVRRKSARAPPWGHVRCHFKPTPWRKGRWPRAQPRCNSFSRQDLPRKRGTRRHRLLAGSCLQGKVLDVFSLKQWRSLFLEQAAASRLNGRCPCYCNNWLHIVSVFFCVIVL